MTHHIGTVFAVVSLFLDGADAYNNGHWETHNTIDAISTGIMFVPVGGEIYGVLYFLGNIVSEGVWNKSLSEKLAVAIGGR